MHRIHKSIATTPSCIRTLRVLVALQSRWHAGPQSKHHERKQIAHGKCSTTSLIEARACGRATHESTRLARLRLIVSVSSGRVVVEPDEEGNGSRDMNKGVDPVCPHHESGVPEEEPLDRNLQEQSQRLFNLYQL